MTSFSTQVAFSVIVKFSAAFAFALTLALALVLASVSLAFAFAFAVSFAAASVVPFAVAFALALAFAFAHAFAYVTNFHWIRFSEVVRDPRLVLVQVGLDDRLQLVLVTLKLLRVHQQMVSEFLWGFTQHHTHFHIVMQL